MTSFFILSENTLVYAQRMTIPSVETTSSRTVLLGHENTVQPQILKTYPDGTKKIVPLAALNTRDEGQDFGGPPQLTLYTDNPDAVTPAHQGRLSVAPIGTVSTPTSVSTVLPSSPDPLVAANSNTAAGDPMVGVGSSDPMGGSLANPMSGGSAPLDPLAGSPPKANAPPLQTVSGKSAPLVEDSGTIQLGVWDGFFLNAGIGGSLQNQLTASRIWNGSNRQAYPYTITNSVGNINYNGTVTGESFTFQPGFRFDTEFGYNIYEWLGVGFQTGVVYNGLQNYTISGNLNLIVPGYGTISGSGDFNFPADGDLIQVPLQMNAILRWPGAVAIRPFLGFGVGAVWQELDVNTIHVGPLDVPGGYGRSGFQFGWNAQLGLTYVVEPGIDFYAASKVLSSCMPVIGNYQFQNSYNFAFEVGIQSRF